jgi:hypothetical protein
MPPVSVRIEAADPWNDTGFDLVAGRAYRLEATGTWQDASQTHDAAGREVPKLERWKSFRRVADAPWFALIGAIDRDAGTHFVIGKQVVYAAKRSGRLFCFANDVRLFYWNNSGHVELTISEQP